MKISEIYVKIGAKTDDFKQGLDQVKNKSKNVAGTLNNDAQRIGDSFVKAGKDAETGLAGGMSRAEAATRKSLEAMRAHAAKAGREMAQNISQAMTTAGTSMSAGLTLPLVALGKGALDSSLMMESLTKALDSITGSSTETAKQLERLRDIAKLPGIGFEEAVRGSVRLQSAGLSAQLAEKSIRAFGNAIAAAGGGKAELDGVALALGQIASKGKVFAEEINQINERVPQIRAAMKAAFGTADTEVLQKMSISTEEFVSKVTTELLKIRPVAGGMKNLLENASDSMRKSLAKLGDAMAPIIKSIVDSMIPAIEQLADSFSKMPPSMQTMIVAFGAIVAALGPLLVIVGTAISSFGTISSALIAAGGSAGIFATAMTVLTGPVGLVIAAVAALAVTIAGVKLAWDAYVNQGIQTEAQMNALKLRHDELAQKRGVEAKQLSELAKDYEKLSQKKKLSNIESERMDSLFNQIAAINPRLTRGFDEQGNAIHGLTKSYAELANEAKRAAENVRASAFATRWGSELEKQVDALGQARADLNRVIGQGISVKIGESNATRWEMVDDGNGQLVRRQVPTGEKKAVYEFRKTGAEYTKALAEAKNKVKELEDAMSKLNTQMKSDSRQSRSVSANVNQHRSQQSRSSGRPPSLQGDLPIKGQVRPVSPFGNDLSVVAMTQSVQESMSGFDKFGQYIGKLVANRFRGYVEALKPAMNALADVNKQIALATAKTGLERLRIEFGNLVPDSMLIKLQEANKQLEHQLKVNEKVKDAIASARKIAIESVRNSMYSMPEGQANSLAQFANPFGVSMRGVSAKVFEAVNSRAKDFRATMRDLAFQTRLLGTNGETTRRVMEKMREGWSQAQASGIVAAERNIEKLQEQREMLAEVARSAADAFIGSIGKIREGFGSFLSSIFSALRSTLNNIAMQFAQSQLQGWLTGALSQKSSSFDSTFAAVASAIGRIPGLATGGTAYGGQPHIVGERGPELFVPGRTGTVVPNGQAFGGGVTVNITINAMDAQSVIRSKSQIVGELVDAIKREMGRS